MSMLKSVTRGKIITPDFICLYGPDGIGKSTFAANAPKPIFLGAEDGTSNLDVARFPTPKTLESCHQAVDELIAEKHDFETLAIDSADWMEPLVLDWICRDANVAHVEQAYGGYNKWIQASTKQWYAFLQKLGELRSKKNMNVIVLAHAQVKKFENPQTNTTYDRYQLKLQDKASALIREKVDCVFFANYEVFTKVEGKNANAKTKAFGDGSRKMYTEHRPSYDAKNRYQLPPELPLSWTDYVEAKAAGMSGGADAILREVTELTKQLPEEAMQKKVMAQVEKAGQNTANLEVIRNRLRTLLSA